MSKSDELTASEAFILLVLLAFCVGIGVFLAPLLILMAVVYYLWTVRVPLVLGLLVAVFIFWIRR